MLIRSDDHSKDSYIVFIVFWIITITLHLERIVYVNYYPISEVYIFKPVYLPHNM